MDHDLAMILIASVIVWRLSRMIAQETGPFALFLAFRSWSGWRRNWVREGVSCLPCVSFWLALPCAWAIDWEMIHGLAGWMAVAGGSTLIWVATE